MRVAALAALLTALVSAPGSAGAEPATLRFVFSAATALARDVYVDLVERFNQSQSDVVVEPVPRLWEAYDLHDSYLRLLALEDPSVDLYVIDTPWVAEMAYPGWLLALDDQVPADWLQGFDPVALRGGRYAGRTYALPYSLKGNLLFYRKDLLKKHGLDPPGSLAELDRQARLLREREGLAFGVGLHGSYFFNDVYPVLWASGGQVVDDAGAVHLNSAANVAALGGVAALFEGGPLDTPAPRALFTGAWRDSYRASLDAFIAGEGAFQVAWSPDLTMMEAAERREETLRRHH